MNRIHKNDDLLNFATKVGVCFLLLIICTASSAQYNVVLGTDNVLITQIGITRITPPSTSVSSVQTTGNLSTIHTTDEVRLDSITINDGGATKVLKFFDPGGAIIANNNFTPAVTGVGVYDQGTETLASSTAAWEPQMVGVMSDRNMLHYLFYDGASNVPAGADFDVLWTKGLTNDDYFVVSERNGNTFYTVTPLDSLGNVIAGARSLRFGFQTGATSPNGNNRYDWNIRYASTGRAQTQPQYMTVVDVDLFNTSSSIYGVRVDNTGDADVKFYGIAPEPLDDNPTSTLVPGLSGNIFIDNNGLNDAGVNGTLTDTAEATTLYVSLVQAGVVVATVPVDSSGNYEFLNILPGTYTTVLHTNPSGSSTPDLPANWVNTGENDGAGSGNDGDINGVSPLVTVTDSLETQINFGIEQRPESDVVVEDQQTNPGGTTNVTVPATSFGGTDPDGGTPTELRITSFPTNATSITINGTTYTSATFPVGGVTVPVNASGEPTQAITIDPVDGSKTAIIPYVMIDEAGVEDLTPGRVELPFVLSLSGTVFNDANGLTDATVNGPIISTPDGTPLYANLVDASGNVIDTVRISPTGTYEFDGLLENTNYSVVLDTLPQTIGAAAVAGNLPTNWVNTGENEGIAAGDDGTVDATIDVTMTTVNKPEVNFGIEKTPLSSSMQSFTLSPSPVLNEVRDLTTAAGMGELTGADFEDGTYGSGDRLVITDTSDMNGNVLFYDANDDGIYTAGEELAPGDTIANYDPTLLSVSFVGNNSTDFEFQFSWVDAAGFSNPTPSTYGAAWSTPVPVEFMYVDAVSVDDRTNKITWATASELNNDYFVVYRLSANGDGKTEIGRVAGSGTSTVTNEYEFIDYSASVSGNCYVIKQVDYDGAFDYSEKSCAESTLKDQVQVYPNPAINSLNIDLSNKHSYNKVSISNISGVVLYEMTIEKGNSPSTVDVSSYESGIYILRFIGKSTKTLKVIVNH